MKRPSTCDQNVRAKMDASVDKEPYKTQNGCGSNKREQTNQD